MTCLKFVDSCVKIFADDTKIYRSVSDGTGPEVLQKDLQAVISWSDKWQLPFSSLKCKSLHIGPRNPCHIYKMRDTVLQQTRTEKDLGSPSGPRAQVQKTGLSSCCEGEPATGTDQAILLLYRLYNATAALQDTDTRETSSGICEPNMGTFQPS